MDTIFINSEDIKTSHNHRLLLNVTDKVDLRRSDKYVDLSNLSIHYTWKSIKMSYKNSKFKILSLKFKSMLTHFQLICIFT